MKKYVADANIGLRILVGDKDIAAASTPGQANQIREMVRITYAIASEVNDGKATLLFTDAVVEEMVFVLQKVYKLERQEISQKILMLIEADNVESSQTIRETLRLFPTVNLDVVDIKLSVLSKELGIPVLTWDKGFAKLSCEYYAPSDVIDKDDSEDDED